ncbi:PAS domain S-box protein [Mesorhizobium sp. CAU 1732]|uniref:PAS domain S-box protein n=1 Tax=Mesorhizobium sp. CAU 1732 TaxID=3140358 RepID=UPI00325FEA1E
MASGPYSFIDIAVLDDVRARFAAGDALAILTTDLDEVIWANGQGAALFGFGDIETVMGATPGLSFAARRQISAAPGFPDMGRDRAVAVRLATGMTSKAVLFLASGITLPDGEPAILLAVAAQRPVPLGETDIASRVIDGFEKAGYFAALLDEKALLTAASDGFADLGIEAKTLTRLVGEVAHEKSRLVKKLVPATSGLIPAGMARLTDDPALHLLIAVDEPIEESIPEDTLPVEHTAAISARSVDQQEEEPAPSDADLPERLDEDSRHDDTLGEGAHGPEISPAPHPWPDEGGLSVAADQPEQAGPPDEGEPEASDVVSDEQTPGDTRVPPPTPGDPDDWYFREHTAAGSIASTAPKNPSPREPHTTLQRSTPIRFVWRTDATGAISALSSEFTRAVGAEEADIVGRNFRDVATEFGLDPDGEIAGLLERRDTWSGRTVHWPVADAGVAVPVDLAALPVYSRDRVFEGFRGFGVARMGDARPVATAPHAVEPAGEHIAQNPSTDLVEPAEAENDSGDPFLGEVPVISIAERRERRSTDKVIRLAEHRQPQPPEKLRSPDRQLSPGERNAFEEIRARLRRDYEAANAAKAEQAEAADAVAESQPIEEPVKPTPGGAGDAQAPRVEELAGDERAQEAGAVIADDEHDAEALLQEEVPEEVYDEAHLRALDGTDEAENETSEPASDDLTDEPVVPGDDDESDDPLVATQPADAEPSAPPVAAPPIAVSGFLPSAFVSDAGRPRIDAELIAGLPMPLLVHAGDDLYFANREFLSLTGYASIDQIRREGGLDRLIVDGAPDTAADPADRKLRIRTLGGDEFPVDAHLQSIRWREGTALLLALRRVAPSPAPVVAAPAHQSVSDDGDMARSVEEMRTILDTATDGVVLIARDGTIRNISRPAEALFGFDSAEVEGKPFATLFAIESQRSARDYLNGLAENGVASVLNDGREVIGREAQGRFIPLFMSIGRLPGDSGYCAVVRDITQWKRAEEELTQARAQAERASSQKTEFLARVSHEIRTPLNAIIGFSELMIDEKFGPIGSDRYRDYLRDINRSGNHVLDLVNDLLDISKIEAGEQEMNYEAVSLNDTLAECVAMMQPQANRDRVIIRSSLASKLPEVVADLRSVRQIALNMLSNAIRYTQAGGQVIVSTAYEPSGDVVMRVRDTGIGMTLSEIDQALKPFKQINALKRGRHDGTGLGLPLTKAMVEANRARFSIASTPGEGTMVEIVFPSTRVLAD